MLKINESIRNNLLKARQNPCPSEFKNKHLLNIYVPSGDATENLDYFIYFFAGESKTTEVEFWTNAHGTDTQNIFIFSNVYRCTCQTGFLTPRMCQECSQASVLKWVDTWERQEAQGCLTGGGGSLTICIIIEESFYVWKAEIILDGSADSAAGCNTCCVN